MWNIRVTLISIGNDMSGMVPNGLKRGLKGLKPKIHAQTIHS